jgi:hypothetical protein
MIDCKRGKNLYFTFSFLFIAFLSELCRKCFNGSVLSIKLYIFPVPLLIFRFAFSALFWKLRSNACSKLLKERLHFATIEGSTLSSC